jgi:iron complex outermembrane recepter protein
MRKITLLFTLLALQMMAVAQNKTFTVSGQANSKQAGIDNVSVTLLRAGDSTIVKLAVSNHRGNFEMINVPGGTYLLRLTSVNYQPYVSAPIVVDKDIAFGTIELKSASKVVGDVTVHIKNHIN